MDLLNKLLEKKKVAQDKDIKDRDGTQPKKYFAKDAEGDEMAKSTKQARARHFEKGRKSADDDDSAYEPAPGDKSAETKPSQHTKKYKKMFGEDLEENVNIKKALSKVKGLTKKQLETLSTINTSQLTVILQQLSSLVMGEQDECWDGYTQKGMKKKGDKMVPNCVPESVEEGKQVAPYRDILDIILKKIKNKIEKEFSKNQEKGVAIMNTLGAMVGHKVSDKGQEKNKLFLKFGEETEIQEDAAVDAAQLKAKHAEQMERLKANHEQELEALKDRHERETSRIDQQKEKETQDKQIQSKRDADRKSAEKKKESQQEERDYKKEYENYHSKPEQIKRRTKRNEARRSLKDRKDIKGKDVHHKDNNPMNNDKSNLSIVSQKYNRTEPRLRKLKEKGILPNGRK